MKLKSDCFSQLPLIGLLASVVQWYSQRHCKETGIGWHRAHTAENICYYQNYHRSAHSFSDHCGRLRSNCSRARAFRRVTCCICHSKGVRFCQSCWLCLVLRSRRDVASLLFLVEHSFSILHRRPYSRGVPKTKVTSPGHRQQGPPASSSDEDEEEAGTGNAADESEFLNTNACLHFVGSAPM